MGDYTELHKKERKAGANKEAQLQALSYVTTAKLANSAANAICGAIIAANYKKANAKIDETISSIKNDIETERSKENPNKDKLALYLKQINKLKRSKVILKLITAGTAVAAATSTIDTTKDIKNQYNIHNKKKVAKAEKNVVTTYDKNGVKEESTYIDIFKQYKFNK